MTTTSSTSPRLHYHLFLFFEQEKERRGRGRYVRHNKTYLTKSIRDEVRPDERKGVVKETGRNHRSNKDERKLSFKVFWKPLLCKPPHH
ncbi:hypothetical protein Syun_022613 [Stephania yunnanensis]|uniref:Uncharacterized protein n=1 Tax=Stephania yunnanensis TaxID=152371 RepID=A0AAP0I1N0_9MAGN